jgi:hypothetical protein
MEEPSSAPGPAPPASRDDVISVQDVAENEIPSEADDLPSNNDDETKSVQKRSVRRSRSPSALKSRRRRRLKQLLVRSTSRMIRDKRTEEDGQSSKDIERILSACGVPLTQHSTKALVIGGGMPNNFTIAAGNKRRSNNGAPSAGLVDCAVARKRILRRVQRIFRRLKLVTKQILSDGILQLRYVWC